MAKMTRKDAGAARLALELEVEAGGEADEEDIGADTALLDGALGSDALGTDSVEAGALTDVELAAFVTGVVVDGALAEGPGVCPLPLMPVSTGNTLPSMVVAPFVDIQIGGPCAASPLGSVAILESPGREGRIFADAPARRSTEVSFVLACATASHLLPRKTVSLIMPFWALADRRGCR